VPMCAGGSAGPWLSPAIRWNEASARAHGRVLVFTEEGGPWREDDLTGLRRSLDSDPALAAVAEPETGLLAVRREAFEAAGGFDEGLPSGAGEMEALLGAIAEAGLKVEVAQSAASGSPRYRRRIGVGARRARGLNSAESPLVGPRSAFLVGDDGARPAVSVVLPAYGSVGWVGVALGSLVRQDIQEPYEVLVVTDAGSAVADALARDWPGCRAVRCDPADGPGGARNRGIEAARGDCIAFTDADCLPDRNWLRDLVAACRRAGGGPVVGWVEAAWPWSLAARATNVALLGMVRPCKSRRVRGLWGGSMCVGADLVRKKGARFAERRYGGEEMVLLWQLGAGRRGVPLEPSARVRHLARDRFWPSVRRQFRLGHGNALSRREHAMRGSVFARHPWLAPLLLPGRCGLLAVHAARNGPGALGELLRLAPLVGPQMLGYTAGFCWGAWRTSPEDGA